MSANLSASNVTRWEYVRNFLRSCKYVTDEELFGQRDYWQPPEVLKRGRKAIAKTSRFGRGDNY